MLQRLYGRVKEDYRLQAVHSHVHPAHAEDTPRHLHKYPMAPHLLTTDGQEACCQHCTQRLPAKGNHAHHLYQDADMQKPNQCRHLGTGTSWLPGLSPKLH